MTFISENIIPGNYGKIFGTDASNEEDLEMISKAILKIDGIVDVIINNNIYPREFTIHTSKVVSVHAIEDEVKSFKFHAIPKAMFPL